MRNAHCYRIAKSLLPNMPGFMASKNGEILFVPIGDTLRGFLFENSAYSRDSFYIWWFFMPVCDPTDHFSLSNGDRLKVPGGDTGWRSDMEDLPQKLLAAMQPILPFLRSLNRPRDTIEALYQTRGEAMQGLGARRRVTDIYVQHDIACLLILDGNFGDADVMLENVIAHENGTDRRQWLLDIVDRAKGLRAKLLHDPQLAVAQVREWQDYTFKALKLEQWR